MLLHTVCGRGPCTLFSIYHSRAAVPHRHHQAGAVGARSREGRHPPVPQARTQLSGLHLFLHCFCIVLCCAFLRRYTAPNVQQDVPHVVPSHAQHLLIGACDLIHASSPEDGTCDVKFQPADAVYANKDGVVLESVRQLRHCSWTSSHALLSSTPPPSRRLDGSIERLLRSTAMLIGC